MLDQIYNNSVVYPFLYTDMALRPAARKIASSIKDIRIHFKHIQADVCTMSVQLTRCTKTHLYFLCRLNLADNNVKQIELAYNVYNKTFQQSDYIDRLNSYIQIKPQIQLQPAQLNLHLCVECFTFRVKPLQLFIQAPDKAYIDLQRIIQQTQGSNPMYLKTKVGDSATLHALHNCTLTCTGNTLMFMVAGGASQPVTSWQAWENWKDFQIDKKYNGLYSINGYSTNIQFKFGPSVISQLNLLDKTILYTLNPGVQV